MKAYDRRQQTVSLSNFRAFKNLDSVQLAPITLLVGENSTGKSSFLAAILALSELVQGNAPDFNYAPFSLGSFEDIAHHHGGRVKRAESFEIAVTIPYQQRSKSKSTKKTNETTPVTYSAKFDQGPGAARLCEAKVATKSISLEISSHSHETVLTLTAHDIQFEVVVETEGQIEDDFPEKIFGFALFIIRQKLLFPDSNDSPVMSKGKLRKMDSATAELRQLLSNVANTNDVIPLAPIRSHPERTYSTIESKPTPQGAHVPAALARLSREHRSTRGQSKKNSTEWDRLNEQFERFGANSGLFTKLSVRNLGRKSFDPFQLKAKTTGPSRNIIDVGYGVSQALPLLFEALSHNPPATFLVQQPEVHLHPRAQAELGTFYGDLATDQAYQFIIETHSDYLVDRIRMDIQNVKGIKADHAIILFFESSGTENIVHRITFDDSGNLVNAPPTYREFFMREEARFLGIT